MSGHCENRKPPSRNEQDEMRPRSTDSLSPALARWSISLGLAVAVAGCEGVPTEAETDATPTNSTGGEEGSTSAGPTTSGSTAALATTSVDSTTSTMTSSDDDNDDEPDPSTNFDLGPFPDIGRIQKAGCQGIDFLFVIDNSTSMAVQQAQLLASFPGFINAIQTSLDGVTSYHVGVVSSDDYIGNEPGCTSIGDLVTQTAGFGSSDSVCGPFASGLRFATDEDNLETVFPCIAQVGASGSPLERPVTATVAALDPAKAEPGACNEGFIREDAILVVVIVTDDPPYLPEMDDANPQTDTSGWYDAVIAAKGGKAESVVMIGFVPTPEDSSCAPIPQYSPNLVDFIEEFGEQGVMGSVCAADFGPLFASAIGTIETTCDNFTPQG